MSNRIAKILSLLAVAALLAILVIYHRDRSSATTATIAGDMRPAPEFNLPDIHGNNVALSQFRGKVVLLNFWATWCPPCRKEIPDLIELHNQYGGQGFAVLGISLDEDGARAVRPFAAEHGINYPLLLGNEKVVADYGNFLGIPTSFLIDRGGRIVKSYEGARPKNMFEADIRQALGAE